MKNKIIFSIIIIIGFNFFAFGKIYCQNAIKALDIGDTITNIQLDNVLNYPGGKVNLANLKGEMILLDFSNADCSACIPFFPTLDSLHKVFKGQMQGFIVAQDKKAVFEKFLQTNAIGKHLTLPVVTQDTILDKYFVHKFGPHEVWINKAGIVCAFTEPEYINATNVKQVLDYGKLGCPMKYELDYDYAQPVMVLNKTNVAQMSRPDHLSYSSFSSYMKGVPKRFYHSIDSANALIKFSVINTPIIQLYFDAIGVSWVTFPENRRIIDIKDMDRVFYSKHLGYRTEWLINNSYCYEFVAPISMPEIIRNQKMTSDLDFYLGLRGRMEKRSVDCWVLRQTGGKIKKPEEGISGVSENLYDLLYILKDVRGIPPVVDETGYSQHQQLSKMLNYSDDLNTTDLKALNEVLHQKGLKLYVAKREVEMFVLTD